MMNVLELFPWKMAAYLKCKCHNVRSDVYRISSRRGKFSTETVEDFMESLLPFWVCFE